MIGREAAVVRRVPILSGYDDIEPAYLLEPIGDRDDGIPVLDRQRSAGDEVVLNIDKNEGVHGLRSPICQGKRIRLP